MVIGDDLIVGMVFTGYSIQKKGHPKTYQDGHKEFFVSLFYYNTYRFLLVFKNDGINTWGQIPSINTTQMSI